MDLFTSGILKNMKNLIYLSQIVSSPQGRVNLQKPDLFPHLKITGGGGWRLDLGSRWSEGHDGKLPGEPCSLLGAESGGGGRD